DAGVRRPRAYPAARCSPLLRRRERLLRAPVVEPANPEVVVLVEVALLACGEEVPTAGEPVFEGDELFVAVEIDLLGLSTDLLFEIGEIRGALLVVDRGDDRRREIEHLLELARRDVEQVA